MIDTYCEHPQLWPEKAPVEDKHLSRVPAFSKHTCLSTIQSYFNDFWVLKMWLKAQRFFITPPIWSLSHKSHMMHLGRCCTSNGGKRVSSTEFPSLELSIRGSQNGWGWKRSLDVILYNPPFQQGHPQDCVQAAFDSPCMAVMQYHFGETLRDVFILLLHLAEEASILTNDWAGSECCQLHTWKYIKWYLPPK